MTPEAKTKIRVRRLLDTDGVYYFMPPGSGYGRAGIPDIVCCAWGRFLAIECKSSTGTPTALQTREIERIWEAGGLAMVIHDNEQDYKGLCNVLEWCRSKADTKGVTS